MARDERNNIKQIGDYRRSSININIGMVIFGLILLYLLIQCGKYLRADHIVGYEVTTGSLSVSKVYTGMAIRDEEVVPCHGAGYINFFTKDAEHVANGDLIYTLDSTGKITQLMEAQESDKLLSDDDFSEIRDQIIVFQNSFEENSFSQVYSFKNQIEATALKLTNYNMLNNMGTWSSSGDNVSFQYAPKSGTVVYEIDGLESLSPSEVDMTYFEERKEPVTLEGNQLVSTSDAAYKLINNENWSIIIPIDMERGMEYEQEGYVKVRFLKNQYESWARVTLLDNPGGTFLKLDFTNSMITFATERYIDIEIMVDEETGLKVPNSAIAEKTFYMVPEEFVTVGPSGKEGVTKEFFNEDNQLDSDFIETPIYMKDEDNYYYIDSANINLGDNLVKKNSDEKFMISKTGTLIGVYNMNKGYADFTAINILYSNEEYSIIKSNTQYGLSEYDFIVLDAESVNPDDFLYE